VLFTLIFINILVGFSQESIYNFDCLSPQEVTQSAGTTPNKVKVSSLNLSPPSCANMSKKKKHFDCLNIFGVIIFCPMNYNALALSP
jgi:hypothetical protein